MCSHLAASTVKLAGKQRVHCLRIWPPLQFRPERLLQHPQLCRLFPQLLRRRRCRLLSGGHRHLCIRPRRCQHRTSGQLEPLGEASLLHLQLVHTSCRRAHLAQQHGLSLGQPIEATERRLMRAGQRVQLVAEARQRQCRLVLRLPSGTGISASTASNSGSTRALQSVQLVVMECIPFHCAPRCTTGRSLVPLNWLCHGLRGRLHGRVQRRGRKHTEVASLC